MMCFGTNYCNVTQTVKGVNVNISGWGVFPITISYYSRKLFSVSTLQNSLKNLDYKFTGIYPLLNLESTPWLVVQSHTSRRSVPAKMKLCSSLLQLMTVFANKWLCVWRRSTLQSVKVYVISVHNPITINKSKNDDIIMM